MNKAKVSGGVDWLTVWLFAILVGIGILCIFMVEYKANIGVLQGFTNFSTSYSKQLLFACIAFIIAIIILLADSKLFTAFANLSYAIGIVLLLATFVLGKNISGSRSWIALGGGFNLQPIELMKIFTALALSKYLARPETDFGKLRSQIIAGLLIIVPVIISALQHELGQGLVYAAFVLVMYREGLPPTLLILGTSAGVLAIAAIIVEPNVLAIILTAIAILFIYILLRQKRRNKYLIRWVLVVWLVCVGFQRFALPFMFNHVFECYQSTRIHLAFGKEYDCSKNTRTAAAGDKKKRQPDNYNVKQSKIAIGSGGLVGQGFLKGTQTRGKYVPEQRTDFIFTSLGEAFGFVGSVVFLGLYLFMLFRIVRMAERQRSTFSRVYAYSVACILFFHIALNICMTLGLFPSPGITLPLISYGGSSLITFTILIFILIRLDADRQMVLR